MYSKFVEQLNKEQSVLLDEEEHSFSMQSGPKVIEMGEKSQSPICETIEQQPRLLSSQVDLESFSQANTNTQGRISEPCRVTFTMMPTYTVNHHPVVLDAANLGNQNLQSNLLVGNNTAASNISNPTLIGQDMWKHLKRGHMIITGSRLTVVSREAKKNQYAHTSSGLCYHDIYMDGSSKI